jgi:hypothetical protein
MDLKGEKHTIKRTPPLKAHEILPTDIVKLTNKRSDDFQAGDELEVKHIPGRHPNTLQLVDDDGGTTFVDYHEVTLEEKIAPRLGVDPRDNPEANRYLLWP